MRVEVIDLALVGGAHRPTRPVHYDRDRQSRLPPQLHELAETRLENALHAPRRTPPPDDGLKQLIEIRTAPEGALEVLRLAPCVAQHERFTKDEPPRDQGYAEQHQHHQLDEQAGLADERDERKIVRDVHTCSFGWSSCSRTVAKLA